MARQLVVADSPCQGRICKQNALQALSVTEIKFRTGVGIQHFHNPKCSRHRTFRMQATSRRSGLRVALSSPFCLIMTTYDIVSIRLDFLLPLKQGQVRSTHGMQAISVTILPSCILICPQFVFWLTSIVPFVSFGHSCCPPWQISCATQSSDTFSGSYHEASYCHGQNKRTPRL